MEKKVAVDVVVGDVIDVKGVVHTVLKVEDLYPDVPYVWVRTKVKGRQYKNNIFFNAFENVWLAEKVGTLGDLGGT